MSRFRAAQPQWDTSIEAIATCRRDKVTDKSVCRMHSHEHPCESNGAEGEAGAHLSDVRAQAWRARCVREGCRTRPGQGGRGSSMPLRAQSPRQHAWSKHPPLKAVISTGGHFPPQAHFVTSGHIFGGHMGAGRAGGQRPGVLRKIPQSTGQPHNKEMI